MAREVDSIMAGRPSKALNFAYKEKRWLRKRYEKEKRSIQAIADICNVSSYTVHDYLKRHGIKRRERSFRKDAKRYDAICCNGNCRRPFKARKDQDLKYSRCPLCQIKAESLAPSYFHTL